MDWRNDSDTLFSRRELLKRMRPDNIRDLIAIMALYRPGPLQGGMVDSYVNRKHGREKPTYHHPLMEEVLRETFGILVYQEQIMRILNRLGGIELSSAYACIKAISKKKHDVIDPPLGHPSQNVLDELTFGLNHHHSTAGLEVLDNEIQQGRGLPRPGGTDDVESPERCRW